MSHWTAGKLLIVLVAVGLTVYPIQELTRVVLYVGRNYPTPGGYLELFLMWWAYLSMPFILWAILGVMKED